VAHTRVKTLNRLPAIVYVYKPSRDKQALAQSSQWASKITRVPTSFRLRLPNQISNPSSDRGRPGRQHSSMARRKSVLRSIPGIRNDAAPVAADGACCQEVASFDDRFRGYADRTSCLVGVCLVRSAAEPISAARAGARLPPLSWILGGSLNIERLVCRADPRAMFLSSWVPETTRRGLVPIKRVFDQGNSGRPREKFISCNLRKSALALAASFLSSSMT